MAAAGGKKLMYSELYKKSQTRGAFDDLVLLDKADNEEIVQVLSTRFMKGDMYTSVGKVLVAVNPYQQLQKGGESIYAEGVARHYFSQDSVSMAPHIFRIASEAYHAVVDDSESQCIIVTGESGAGKTEAAKQIMTFVTAVGTVTEAQRKTMDDIKRHLLESNPILEAFGNAQTIRNDNSSRFGKYMELQFSYRGDIRGGRITNYLLEKSRVCGQASGERSFHIIHYLIQGATDEEKESLALGNAQDYAYLMNRGSKIAGVDDAAELNNLRGVMSDMGISPAAQHQIFGLLSGILTLGNVIFTDHGDGNRATVENTTQLERAAAQLGVNALDLEKSLSSTELHVGRATGQGHVKNFNRTNSHKNRDTLAREIYKRLFDWMVTSINSTIESQQRELVMGILDIYGFEIFEENGFDQFCINYVNEKLQQFFIDHTIKVEQEEYEREGIEWAEVEYFNNKVVVDMIESKTGMLSMLDELCTYQGTSAHDLVNRYTKSLADINPHYLRGKMLMYNKEEAGGRSPASTPAASPMSLKSPVGRSSPFSPASKSPTSRRRSLVNIDTIFGIAHYAGTVGYNAEQFVEKNLDSLYHDVQSLLSHSKLELARQLFPSLDSLEERARRPVSISVQFKRQVSNLCATLSTCRPHYVRCIKPNEEKLPMNLNGERMCHQVTYLGLSENVHVRKQGFVHRMPYKLFIRRYQAICQSTWPDAVPVKFWPDGTRFDPANPEPPESLRASAKETAPTGGGDVPGNEDHQSMGGKSLTAESESPGEVAGEGLSSTATIADVVLDEEPGVVNEEAHGSPSANSSIADAAEIPLTEKLIWTPCTLDDRDAVLAILTAGRPKTWDTRLTAGKKLILKPLNLDIDRKEIVMGKTMIFVRHPQTLFELEEQRLQALQPVLTIIQRRVRAFCGGRRYARVLKAIPKAQALARRFVARCNFGRTVQKLIKVQSVIRQFLCQRRTSAMRRQFKSVPPRVWALRLQRQWRSYAARRRQPADLMAKTLPMGRKILAGVRRLHAAILFQATWRMHCSHKRFLAKREAACCIQRALRCRWAKTMRRTLIESEFERTVAILSGGGIPQQKHTLQKITGSGKVSDTTVSLSKDLSKLHWTGGALGKGAKGARIADVAFTRGFVTEVLHKTGTIKKGDEGLSAGGVYWSVHMEGGGTVDFESVSYKDRDAIYRTLTRIKGKAAQ